MKARVLPPDEWDRLEDASLPALYRSFIPPETEIVVVEDEDGVIVARMMVMRITHLEGVWIDSQYKGVAGPLLAETFRVCSKFGDKWVLAGADSDKMKDILRRMGGHEWPGHFYALGG